MKKKQKNKVLLFGGSFDPIHNGHLAMLQHVDAFFHFDQIIIIPAKSSPFKNHTFACSKNRLKMVEAAFNFEPELRQKVVVSTFEIEQSGNTSYTIDTVNAICVDKRSEYYYLIGGDQLNQFEAWKSPNLIAKKVKLIALSRDRSELNPKIIKKYHIHVFDNFDYPMSSSAFRDFESLDVPPDVLDYVYQLKLYWAKDLYAFLQDDKYFHSFNVMRISENIYQSNHFQAKINLNALRRAALLHDLGKYFSRELVKISEVIDVTALTPDSFVSKAVMSFDVDEYNKYITLIKKVVPAACIHAFSGEYLARKIFNINDEQILSAIRYHCTGNTKMELLDQIIYAADKVDVRIGREGSEEAERLYKIKNNFLESQLLKDFKVGFKLTLESNIKYLVAKEGKNRAYNVFTDGMVKAYCSQEVEKLYFGEE